MKTRLLSLCLTALVSLMPVASADSITPPALGNSQAGAQRVFPMAGVTGNQTGQIIASTQYQVSITLPAEIQHVGVNASKQAALVPTVDKSDGRVVYLDVLKPGGTATLNIRLVNEGDPLIVKFTVTLSDASQGVLSYAVRTDLKDPAIPAVSGDRTRAQVPVAVPALRPAPVSAPVPKPAAVPLVKVQDGVRIELLPTPGQLGLTRTFGVKVSTLTPQDTAYRIEVTANAAVQGRPAVRYTRLSPRDPHQIGKTEFSGRLTVTFTEPATSVVILVLVRPVHGQTTGSGHYIGFQVRL
ncbi:hypothetical protein ACFSR9_13305 [Deinococcus taklimakanensis]|uniref:Uncharacterized protein n=1 Tax=Deinococcus taklimakanensis TaxID=536443 RepID=A0ABW5P525_9DEIO